jgi:hypothetical protein
MGQGQGVPDLFGACPMVRQALAHDCVQSSMAPGSQNSDYQFVAFRNT